MPADTSSYPTQVQQPNVLNTLGAAAGIQNTLNQNRLFQQMFNTNLAVSNIYKQAIKPDGTIDQDKLTQLLKTDPNASYGLPQAYQGSQEAQQRNLNISQAQIDLARQNNQTLTGYLGPLASNKNVTPSDVYSAASMAVTRGHVNPDIISKYLADMPQQGGAPLQAWLQGHLLQAMTNEQQFSAMNPTPTMVQTPQGQIPYSMPQVGTPHPVGAMIPNVPGPTTQKYNPVTHQMEYVGNLPNGGMDAPDNQSGGQGGNIGLTPGTPAAPPLGAETVSNTTQGGSASAWNSLKNDQGNVAARLFQLDKALTSVQGAQTGPGSESLQNARSFLLTLAPNVAKGIGLVDPNQIKDYDEANKYLTAYAISQSAQLGQGTNEKLASAITANASTHISNLAAQDVIKANIALERMKQAQALAFKNSGGDANAGNFSDWQLDFNKNTDPRAFLIDKLSPQDRSKMINGMKPAEQKKFLNSVRLGINTGVLNLQDLQAAGAQ